MEHLWELFEAGLRLGSGGENLGGKEAYLHKLYFYATKGGCFLAASGAIGGHLVGQWETDGDTTAERS